MFLCYCIEHWPCIFSICIVYYFISLVTKLIIYFAFRIVYTITNKYSQAKVWTSSKFTYLISIFSNSKMSYYIKFLISNIQIFYVSSSIKIFSYKKFFTTEIIRRCTWFITVLCSDISYFKIIFITIIFF